MPSPTYFHIDSAVADAAATYILTIEPKVGDDPAPSAVHILAGDFAGTSPLGYRSRRSHRYRLRQLCWPGPHQDHADKRHQ